MSTAILIVRFPRHQKVNIASLLSSGNNTVAQTVITPSKPTIQLCFTWDTALCTVQSVREVENNRYRLLLIGRTS